MKYLNRMVYIVLDDFGKFSKVATYNDFKTSQKIVLLREEWYRNCVLKKIIIKPIKHINHLLEFL